MPVKKETNEVNQININFDLGNELIGNNKQSPNIPIKKNLFKF